MLVEDDENDPADLFDAASGGTRDRVAADLKRLVCEQLPAEALVPLLRSDDLAVESEEQVLEFVQAWVARDAGGRRPAGGGGFFRHLYTSYTNPRGIPQGARRYFACFRLQLGLPNPKRLKAMVV